MFLLTQKKGDDCSVNVALKLEMKCAFYVVVDWMYIAELEIPVETVISVAGFQIRNVFLSRISEVRSDVRLDE